MKKNIKWDSNNIKLSGYIHPTITHDRHLRNKPLGLTGIDCGIFCMLTSECFAIEILIRIYFKVVPLETYKILRWISINL